MLGIILAAYREFEDRLSLVEQKLSATELVEKAIQNKIGTFTKNDILEEVPGIKRASVENALKELVKQKKIERLAGGRSTHYLRK